MSDQEWTPVTHATCGQVAGPFYHGTRWQLAPGELLTPRFASNYEDGPSNPSALSRTTPT